ncbi:MAG: hypothetical protein HN658_08775 [Rhodospirillales bacterium]|jgi:hypothetical protein|nr:hypothetical protein [Rhodospirillales bacterium]MBT4005921.1 hypothetical protein [Rhodospirillales bacterium]MBT5076366.1 hypothetical protein [Rhodospirillales bacterium]MBT5112663.1 hypothetical protein [Rhodospirillales bacterium]MBT5673432.1 hypothetical protein [Rhodospirillales bacterium]
MQTKLLIAGILSLFLGACSGDSIRIIDAEFDTAYDYMNFSNYLAGKDTTVQIHGNPFAMNKAAFAQALTQHMQGANEGMPTNFTTTPKYSDAQTTGREFRVIVAFNANPKPSTLCTAKKIRAKKSAKKPDDVLTVHLAWCFENDAHSAITAETSMPESAQDPRFRALIRQSVQDLFPQGHDYVLTQDHGGPKTND